MAADRDERAAYGIGSEVKDFVREVLTGIEIDREGVAVLCDLQRISGAERGSAAAAERLKRQIKAVAGSGIGDCTLQARSRFDNDLIITGTEPDRDPARSNNRPEIVERSAGGAKGNAGAGSICPQLSPDFRYESSLTKSSPKC